MFAVLMMDDDDAEILLERTKPDISLASVQLAAKF